MSSFKKINASVYEFRSRPCHACQSEARDLIAEKDRFRLPTKTVLCKECSFLYTDPVMRESDYIDFYSNHYLNLYRGVRKPGFAIFKEQSMRGESTLKFIKEEESVKRLISGTVVDIGCGAGGVLYPFYKAGYSTVGFDYNKEYLAFGNSKGLELKHMDDMHIMEIRADIVIVFHVLEHIS